MKIAITLAFLAILGSLGTALYFMMRGDGTNADSSKRMAGALAVRERVRPPSMTRVVASLFDLGLVERAAHPADGRQILVTASPAGAALVERERQASQEWLRKRLASLCHEDRETLLRAADLMTVLVDEDA